MQHGQQNALIDALGGPSKVSRLTNLSPQAISQWKKRGIPKGWQNFLLCQYGTLKDKNFQQPLDAGGK